jgi:hypothetical protein
MTDIQGIGRTSGLGLDASGGAGLDSDTLLSYCAAQLDEMNGDIKSRLAAQQQTRDSSRCSTPTARLTAARRRRRS